MWLLSHFGKRSETSEQARKLPRRVSGRFKKLQRILVMTFIASFSNLRLIYAEDCFDTPVAWPFIIGEDKAADKNNNDAVFNVFVDVTPSMVVYSWENGDNSIDGDNRLQIRRVDPTTGEEGANGWHMKWPDNKFNPAADQFTVFLYIDKLTESQIYIGYARKDKFYLVILSAADGTHLAYMDYKHTDPTDGGPQGIYPWTKYHLYGNYASANSFALTYDNPDTLAYRITMGTHDANPDSTVTCRKTDHWARGAGASVVLMGAMGDGYQPQDFNWVAVTVFTDGSRKQNYAAHYTHGGSVRWSAHSQFWVDGHQECYMPTAYYYKTYVNGPYFYAGYESQSGNIVCAHILLWNQAGGNSAPSSGKLLVYTNSDTTANFKILDIWGNCVNQKVSMFLFDRTHKRAALLIFNADNTYSFSWRGFIQGNAEIQQATLTDYDKGFYSGYFTNKIYRYDATYSWYYPFWPQPWEDETISLASSQGFVMNIQHANTCLTEEVFTQETGTAAVYSPAIISGFDAAHVTNENSETCNNNEPFDGKDGRGHDQPSSFKANHSQRNWCRATEGALTITDTIVDQTWTEGDPFSHVFDEFSVTGKTCDDIIRGYQIISQSKNGGAQTSISFTLDDASRTIAHVTDATAVTGDYFDIVIQMLLPDGQSHEVSQRITVIAACSLSAILINYEQPDHTYYLDRDGAVVLGTNAFVHTVTGSGCTINYSLQLKLTSNSGWNNWNAVTHPWISFNSVTGEYTINSNNGAYDLNDWDLRISAKNPDALCSICTDKEDEVVVKLRDRCRIASVAQALDRINFNNEVTIWDRNHIDFIGLVYDQTTCPIRYELREFLMAGNPMVAGGFYSFDQTDIYNPDLDYRAVNDSWDDGDWRYYIIRAVLQTTSQAYDIETHEVEIAVYYNNPCNFGASAIAAQSHPDMIYTLGATTEFYTFPAYTDTVTATYGEAGETNLCGNDYWMILVDELYDPIPAGHMLSLNTATRTVSLYTTDQADYTAGVLTYYYLKVWFKNYSDLNTVRYDRIRVRVDACLTTALTPTPIPVTDYNVYTPRQTIYVADFVQTPACGYVLEYSVEVLAADWNPVTQDISAFSHIFRVNYVGNVPATIEVFSNDPNVVQSYHIRITASVPLADMNPTYSDYQDIVVNIDNDCQNDEIRVTSSHQTYFVHWIVDDPPIVEYPTWSSTVAGCPVTYGIVYDNGGVETAVPGSVFTWDDPMTYFRIDNHYFQYDGEIWDVKVYKQSTYSEHADQRADIEFQIEWRDICWDAVLVAPGFRNYAGAGPPYEYTFDIYSKWELTYIDLDSDLALYCGGYTHEMLYSTGPLRPTLADPEPSLFFYDWCAVDPECFEGHVTDLKWEGTHEMIMRGYNGYYDITNPRGVDGLYNYIDSVFTLTLVDPCKITTVTPRAMNDLHAEATQDEQYYLGWEDWTDTKATAYGNGVDICGPRGYYLTDRSDNRISFSWLVWQPLVNILDPSNAKVSQLAIDFAGATHDVWSFVTDTYIPQSDAGTHYVRLHSYLVDYPTANHGTLDFNIVVADCQITSFGPAEVEHQYYFVGQTPLDINFQMQQSPCDFDVLEYEIKEIDSRNRIQNRPSFVKQHIEEPIIRIFTEDKADYGNYTLQVTATLNNVARSKATFTFNLTIVKPYEDWHQPANTDPYFEPAPSNQFAPVGEAWSYTLGIPLDREGDNVTVSVDFGDTPQKVGFLSNNNTFWIHEGATSDLDAGFYYINLTLTDDNPDDPANVTYQFRLHIGRRPEFVPPPVVVEPTIFDASRWDIVQGEQKYQTGNPIPFIISLDYSGLLTIGFDREMAPPIDQQPIEQDKVAVRDLREQSLFKFPNGTEPFPMTIVPVLEIEVNAGPDSDPEKLNFEWQLLNYTDNYMWIQLYFEEPLHVSEHRDLDSLTVYFWGKDYFKSKDGKHVTEGASITMQLVRQVEPSYAKGLERFARAVTIILAISAMLIFFLMACTFGSLLPFWAFINSLQLIVHTPLIATMMPGNVAIVLKDLLNFSRLNLVNISERMRDTWGFEINEIRSHSVLFQEFGYNSIYMIPNLGFIFIILMICLGLIFLAVAKDLCLSRVPQKHRDRYPVCLAKTTPMATNISIRVFYEAFFIVCLSVFINLSNWDDKDSQSYTLGDGTLVSMEYWAQFGWSKFFTLAFLFACIAFILYVESLFCRESYYMTKVGSEQWDLKVKGSQEVIDRVVESKQKSQLKLQKQFDDSLKNKDASYLNDHSNIGLHEYKESEMYNTTQNNLIKRGQNDAVNIHDFDQEYRVNDLLDEGLSVRESQNTKSRNAIHAQEQYQGSSDSEGFKNKFSSLFSKTRSHQHQKSGLSESVANRTHEPEFSDEHEDEDEFKHAFRGFQKKTKMRLMDTVPGSIEGDEKFNDSLEDGLDSQMVHPGKQFDTIEIKNQNPMKKIEAKHTRNQNYMNQVQSSRPGHKVELVAVKNNHQRVSSQALQPPQQNGFQRRHTRAANDKILLDIDLLEGGQPETEEEIVETVQKLKPLYKPLNYVSTLFDGLKLGDPNQIALVHCLLYLARRLLFAAVLVAWTAYPLGQIMIFLTCSACQIWLLHLKKQWEDDYMLWLQMFNEWCVFLTGVHCAMFLEEVPLASVRYYIGTSLIVLVMIFIIVNQVFIWFMAFRLFQRMSLRSQKLDKVRARQLDEKTEEWKEKIRGNRMRGVKRVKVVKLSKEEMEAKQQEILNAQNPTKVETEKSEVAKPWKSEKRAYRKEVSSISVQTGLAYGNIIKTKDQDEIYETETGKLKSNAYAQEYMNAHRNWNEAELEGYGQTIAVEGAVISDSESDKKKPASTEERRSDEDDSGLVFDKFDLVNKDGDLEDESSRPQSADSPPRAKTTLDLRNTQQLGVVSEVQGEDESNPVSGRDVYGLKQPTEINNMKSTAFSFKEELKKDSGIQRKSSLASVGSDVIGLGATGKLSQKDGLNSSTEQLKLDTTLLTKAPSTSGPSLIEAELAKLQKNKDSQEKFSIERELAKAEHYLATDPTLESHLDLAYKQPQDQ